MTTDAFNVHDWNVMMAYVGVEQKDRDKVVALARFIEQQRIDAVHSAHEAGTDASCAACQPILVPA